MNYIKSIKTPIGIITIKEKNNKIIELQLNSNLVKPIKENEQIKETPLLIEAEKQLTEYFNKTRTKFDLPLAPQGTDFMKRVWKELIKIPYGETRTYKQIAQKIGNEKASRAVGMANNKNPIPIIIPCHRVIGANNKLIGYALGLDKKEFLLNLEKNNKNKKRG